ncbi:response regulator transcription factor [Gloeocapsa sp. PCC 73106]|uniref:response regulator transcription factor n=1 Tax=Gloeocapsa sp. PCC 73106 TaxID=102232 RepID=UPI0002ACB41B|nr:response regulator [Gloeocapsa sp. PCC 73106]ELR98129.1 response regulator with CheY-like receiver domain and winged-helix DNA-binding domain [Gloeocapsa sp. PCC 73106]
METALIVEDSPTQRGILTGYLQELGINVVIANSGEEALVKIAATQPDLIVLDVVLPGRSGFEICRDLKNQEKTKKIPIIICSTKDSEMDKFWGLKQGANAYLAKPIDQEEFVRTVKQLING